MADCLPVDPNNTVTLVIPNFQKYEVNRCYNTSYFYIGEAKHCFYLTVYPHGFNERVEDYVSLWVRKYSKDEMLLDFTCCILNDQDEGIYEKATKQNLTLESVLGWNTFCRRHVVLDERNKILKDGNLTLKCTFVICGKNAIPNAETECHDPFFKTSLAELSSNLCSLYSEKNYSDFTIKVDGKELSVHKAILSARSPVLKGMLLGNLSELEISDVNAETFAGVLNFIYTGDTGTITGKTAPALYYAASKYGLLFLRNMCSKVLEHNLESDSVIEILLLAHRHTDPELVDACLCFLDKHLRVIKGKKEWLELMKSHPDLANRAIFFQAEA